MTTELRIERLGHRGDGVAAGPVFVPLTLPGEKVEGVVEITVNPEDDDVLVWTSHPNPKLKEIL